MQVNDDDKKRKMRSKFRQRNYAANRIPGTAFTQQHTKMADGSDYSLEQWGKAEVGLQI